MNTVLSLFQCSKFFRRTMNLRSLGNRHCTSSSRSSESKQHYDYFLVLDFEATCDKPTTPEPQEIIEFPVLKVVSSSFSIESAFHRYVKPQVQTELTSFCTELTGIIQDMVDGQPHLDQVLNEFHTWMNEEGLLSPDCKFIFVTCGDWDLKSMLPKQCNHFNIPKQAYFNSWINIKKSYSEVTRTWPKDLTTMCLSLGLPLVGRLHSGIDDCRNIASVLRNLGRDGYVFHPFPTGKPEIEVSRRAHKKTQTENKAEGNSVSKQM